jgi:hypothetical protein
VSGVIRYVSALANGSGDGLTPATAWTAQQGATSAPSGSEVRIMADGVYTSQINVNHTVPEDNHPEYVGSSVDGLIDGTHPIFDGTSHGANTDIITISAPAKFRNITIRNASRHGVGFALARTLILEDCNFLDCVNGFGVSVLANTGARVRATRCLFRGNQYGIGSQTGARFTICSVKFCTFIKNVIAGIMCGSTNQIVKNIFIRNGVGILRNTIIGDSIIHGNTFLKQALDAIDISLGAPRVDITDNIFRRSGQYAINIGTETLQNISLQKNTFSISSGGHFNITGLEPWGLENSIVDDPRFVSEIDDEENVELASDSPIKTSGLRPAGY